MGPWCHGCWERSEGSWLGTAYFGGNVSLDYRRIYELPFFNHFLKDKGDISQIKEVNGFDTGTNQWVHFGGWNPTPAVDVPIYLQSNVSLSFDEPTVRGTPTLGRRAGGTAGPPRLFDEYVS